MSFSLDQVVPWGRSLDEYRRMFDLTPSDIEGPILGCGDGPASFNAEMTALGHPVVSCDPIYGSAKEDIARRVEATYTTIIEQVKVYSENFVWTDFRNPEHLGECRLAAMRRFLEDFDRGKAEGRYVEASLPILPFATGQFRLALCSHLLFLYSEQFSEEFHLASIKELVRIAGEVRIFPLLNLGGKPSPHVEPIRSRLMSAGFDVGVVRVPYEFQKRGNEMFCVRTPSRPTGQFARVTQG
jgi:hypothetical protein